MSLDYYAQATFYELVQYALIIGQLLELET
jgi:hypothetical protein